MQNTPSHIRKSFVYLYIGFAVIACLSLVFIENKIRHDVVDATYGDLKQSLVVSEKILKEELAQYRQLVQVLHDTPPIHALMRNKTVGAEGNADTSAKEDITTIFTAMMKRNAHILQLAVIGLENNGREIVRVSRQQGFVTSAPEPQLLEKANEGYFSEINQLQNNQIYISYFHLNREYGKITIPYTPTIKMAIPLFQPGSNERFGFLIANIDATYIIKQVNSAVRDRLDLMLFDEAGYFVSHPNEAFQFSRDLDTTYTFQGQYEFVQNEGDAFAGMKIYKERDSGKQIHALISPIYTGNNYLDGHNYLQILLSQDESVFNSEINERRSTALFLVVIALTLMLAMLILFVKLMRNSLTLANARSEFEAIINSTSEAIVGIDHQGYITSWNYAASRLFDIAEQDALGKTFDQLQVFKEDIAADINALVNDMFVPVKEFDAISKNHHRFPVSVSFSPIRKNAQSVAGAALLIRDISVERHAQQEVKKVHQNLEKQVNERTAELAIAHREALKSSDLKSAFISNVSHEMRTPLNGILGFVHLLKQGSLSESQKRYLKMMETSSSSLLSLINDLLDVSKIEAGKLDFDNIDFNLIVELESIADSLVIKAENKGLILDIDLSSVTHINVQGDPNRLKQIVINLMTNAIKFTHKGYVSLSAKTTQLESNDILLQCEIKDTGIGIAKENQKKLFEAFTQEDGKTATQFGGTGLGLSICKQLTQLMGGDIYFESEKNKGSTFTFTVKLNQPALDCAPLAQSLQSQQFLICSNADWPKASLQNYVTRFGGSAILLNDYLTHSTPPHIDVVIVDKRLTNAVSPEFYENFTNPDGSQAKVILIKSVQSAEQCNDPKFELLSSPVRMSDFLHAVDHQDVNIPPLTERGKITQLAEHRFADGLQVLIVDDNGINIEVANAIVSNMNVKTHTATSGQQAIDVLKQCEADQQHIDVILMDCQMPDMDGYQTTQHIRQGQAGNRYLQTPIIAMTANAFSGAKEKCLASGMNDYLTKPIDRHLLFEKILVVTQHPSAKSAEADTHEAMDKGNDKPAIDSSCVDENPQPHEHLSEYVTWNKTDALMRLMNNDDLLKKVCGMFVERLPNKYELLAEAFANKDEKAIVLHSHSIKGLSAEIGAEKLNAAMKSVERAARDQDFENAQAVFLQSQALTQPLIEEIQAYLCTEKPDAT